MTPLQLLKQIQSKNHYHMNNIINRNVNRFFRFISPFLSILALVIVVLYISNNTYTYKPQEPRNIEILSVNLLELHKEKDEVRTNINDKYVAYNVKGKFDVYNCKNEKVNTVVLDNVNVQDTYNINIKTIKKEKNGEIVLIGETKTLSGVSAILSFLTGALLILTVYFSLLFIGDLIIFIFVLFEINPFYNWNYVGHNASKISSLWTSLFYIPDYNPKYHYIPASYYLWFYIKEFFGYKLTEDDIYYTFVKGNYDFEQTYRYLKEEEIKNATII